MTDSNGLSEMKNSQNQHNGLRSFDGHRDTDPSRSGRNHDRRYLGNIQQGTSPPRRSQNEWDRCDSRSRNNALNWKDNHHRYHSNGRGVADQHSHSRSRDRHHSSTGYRNAHYEEKYHPNSRANRRQNESRGEYNQRYHHYGRRSRSRSPRRRRNRSRSRSDNRSNKSLLRHGVSTSHSHPSIKEATERLFVVDIKKEEVYDEKRMFVESREQSYGEIWKTEEKWEQESMTKSFEANQKSIVGTEDIGKNGCSEQNRTQHLGTADRAKSAILGKNQGTQRRGPQKQFKREAQNMGDRLDEKTIKDERCSPSAPPPLFHIPRQAAFKEVRQEIPQSPQKPHQPYQQPYQQPTRKPNQQPFRQAVRQEIPPSPQKPHQPYQQPTRKPNQQPFRQAVRQEIPPSPQKPHQPYQQPTRKPNQQPFRQAVHQGVRQSSPKPAQQEVHQKVQQPAHKPSRPPSQPSAANPKHLLMVKRGEAPLYMIESMENPEGEAKWQMELSQYPKKRQRNPQITGRQKAICEHVKATQPFPRGSVDRLKIATRYGIEPYMVTNQFRKRDQYKTDAEQLWKLGNKEKRQRLPALTPKQRECAEESIMTSDDPIRGSVDLENVRKDNLPFMRKEQLSYVYRTM